MDIQKIFSNNEKWVYSKVTENSQYFEKLAEGQSPNILYIGCSDSRVVAEQIMGANPGDIFVHRNIANMVLSTDMNVISVIEYAVTQLKVEHIIICGHYNCGGIKAAMETCNLGMLNAWLKNIQDVYRLHEKTLNAITDEHARHKKFVELNVEEQCVNVLKLTSVQGAYKAHALSLHGWVFDVYTGKIIDLNIDFNVIQQTLY